MESKENVPHRVQVRLRRQPDVYTIEVGAGVLENLGSKVRGVLSPHARRVALISNQRVFDLYGDRTLKSLRRADYDVVQRLIGDGESYKNLKVAEQAVQFLAQNKFERSDAVVALGGGVVGDLAGFAAAVYLRGIAFVQVPTTLLAQVDASVGGKTGVNTAAGGKNSVGAFHQPRLVLIDTETLKTLPAREMQAGWCEAIKQGAVGNRRLFNETRRFLMRGWQAVDESGEQLAELIAAQCEFKSRIVSGDEREELERTDWRSRRILNFGHTIAHALETATDYKLLLHGEAVGYGMLAAAQISVRIGLLKETSFNRLRETIGMIGSLPRVDVNEEEVLQLLEMDKKSVGGQLKWVLLERLGRARIVDNREIEFGIVREALSCALHHDCSN